jgi:hypothetical protein
MTGGAHLSMAAGAGGRGGGWRRVLGRRGRDAALGCGAAGPAGWARSLAGLKRKGG